LGSRPHSDFPQKSFVWEIDEDDSRPPNRETDLAPIFELGENRALQPARTYPVPVGHSELPCGPRSKPPKFDGTYPIPTLYTYPGATLHLVAANRICLPYTPSYPIPRGRIYNMPTLELPCIANIEIIAYYIHIGAFFLGLKIICWSMRNQDSISPRLHIE
jgi:hypothetical protein